MHSEILEIIMKTIFKKYDKHAIVALPRVIFEGEIKVIDHPEDVEAAIDFLLSQDILGIDTETRPSFKRGVSYEVCLLQVSTEDVCFLFRLNYVGMHPAIIRFLTDKKVPKIGLSWHDDLNQLHKRADFEPGNFIEIQDMAKDLGLIDMSLQKIYANLFHQKISKAQRLSNWEVTELKDSQKIYAATDAWACIQLYKEFNKLNETHDYVLIEPKIEEPQTDASQAESQSASQVESHAEFHVESQVKPQVELISQSKASS